jgi:hypothetical protein
MDASAMKIISRMRQSLTMYLVLTMSFPYVICTAQEIGSLAITHAVSGG